MIRFHAVLVLVGASALAAPLFTTAPACAADRRAEAAAKAALKKAANDYLSTDYAAGAGVLEKAVRTCGANKCTGATRAALLRDLGTMQFRNGDIGAAKKSWADAVKLQPDLSINPDYDAPDLRAAWEEAKGNAAAGGGGAQPTGDFAHTPAPEQKANTPLPVYVEYPGTSKIVRVVLKYRGAQMKDWQRVDLKREGSGWGGNIPCSDVTRGSMRYWVQGFDDGGDPVAGSGEPKHPYTVAIKDDISGEAPHLPGKSAPKTCGEDTDCPPGLPGCDKEEETAGGGESEETGNAKEEASKGYARIWVGVSGSLDFLQLSAGDDLCKLTDSSANPPVTAPGKTDAQPLNSANYYCTNPDGTDFPSRSSPAQNSHLSARGQAGHLDGGLKPGNVRVMLAFDYALTANFLAGARLGYVLNAYTGNAAVKDGRSFGPKVHAEARATYLFGHEPLGHAGFAPMAFAALGVSEFDAHATSVVHLDNVAGQLPVDIWLTDGPFFVAFGGGARYQFSPRAAFTAALRINVAIGGNGTLPTYGPEIGVQYGF